MKADMHIHSSWSDGSLPIALIVKIAKRRGLNAISITDHDTLAGQEEAREEGWKQGLRIIPGIEISAFDPANGKKVHILGYEIRDSLSVNRACLPYLKERGQANLKAIDKIRRADYLIDRADMRAYTGKQGILYRQHIMHALADRGYTETIYGALYTRLFGPQGLATTKSSYMPVREALRLIQDCGGKAVLAHPFQYDSLPLLPKLVEWGLAGIEYRHPTQTPHRIQQVQEKAGRYGLFLTGGSDFHGLYSEKPVSIGDVVCEL
ncbi:MAG: PHP domain-containing protein [Spirochaetales bacterium]|jgi:predicted metal-dependent phosphoesterase TrpH|nr:PHP domain-containing protein [Spirochaetales bacterium]